MAPVKGTGPAPPPNSPGGAISAPIGTGNVLVSTITARHPGAGVKFDRPFMQWIKDDTPKTMGAVADEWRRRQGDAW